MTSTKSAGYSGSPRFSPRIVRFTPKGLAVKELHREISKERNNINKSYLKIDSNDDKSKIFFKGGR